MRSLGRHEQTFWGSGKLLLNPFSLPGPMILSMFLQLSGMISSCMKVTSGIQALPSRCQNCCRILLWKHLEDSGRICPISLPTLARSVGHSNTSSPPHRSLAHASAWCLLTPHPGLCDVVTLHYTTIPHQWHNPHPAPLATQGWGNPSPDDTSSLKFKIKYSSFPGLWEGRQVQPFLSLLSLSPFFYPSPSYSSQSQAQPFHFSHPFLRLNGMIKTIMWLPEEMNLPWWNQFLCNESRGAELVKRDIEPAWVL